MWHLDSITVHLVNDKEQAESLTWGYDGKKDPADFAQMILIEIIALLANRNPRGPVQDVPVLGPTPEPVYLPAIPRAATNRPARSHAKGKKN